MVSEQREMNEFLERKLNRTLYAYVLQRPVQPQTVGDVMNILQQWLMSQRRTGNVSISPNAGSLKPLQHQYDSPNHNPYQNDNSGASAPNVQWPSTGHQ